MVYSFFIQVLVDEPLHLINRDAKCSGKLAWELLIEKYLGDANSRKITAFYDLFNFKMRYTDDLISFLDRLQDIRQRMDESGQHLEDII